MSEMSELEIVESVDFIAKISVVDLIFRAIFSITSSLLERDILSHNCLTLSGF